MTINRDQIWEGIEAAVKARGGGGGAVYWNGPMNGPFNVIYYEGPGSMGAPHTFMWYPGMPLPTTPPDATAPEAPQRIAPGKYPIREHGSYRGDLVVREVRDPVYAASTYYARWAGSSAEFATSAAELRALGVPVVR